MEPQEFSEDLIDLDEPPKSNVENIDAKRENQQTSFDTDNLNPDFANSERSFPDAIDGTPRDFVSKTVAEEQNEAQIERPMQTKLQKADLQDLKMKCADAIQTINGFEEERNEINAEIQAIRETLVTYGISKKALAMAIQVSKMTEAQMDGFDTAFKILREVLNRPLQSDLFEGMPGPTENRSESVSEETLPSEPAQFENAQASDNF